MNGHAEIRIEMRTENGMNSGNIHAEGDPVSIAASMIRAILEIAEEMEAKGQGDGKEFMAVVGMELLGRAAIKQKGGNDDGRGKN